MFFQTSVPDLMAIFACAAVAVVMYLRRSAGLRWSLAVLGCVTLAAVITPADLFSTLVMALAMIAVYSIGTRHHSGLKLTSA